MNLVSFSLILLGVLLNAVAQLLLKAGTNAVGHFDFHWDNVVPVGMKLAFQPYIMGGMACYGVSVVVWILGLSRVPVSVAYPMLSIGYVINALVARFWLGETLSASGWAGIASICLGVWLMARQG